MRAWPTLVRPESNQKCASSLLIGSGLYVKTEGLPASGASGRCWRVFLCTELDYWVFRVERVAGERLPKRRELRNSY